MCVSEQAVVVALDEVEVQDVPDAQQTDELRSATRLGSHDHE